MSDRPEVSLRQFEEGDAPAVHRWFNNPEATKSLMEQRDGFSLEQAGGWAKRAMDDSREDRKAMIRQAAREYEKTHHLPAHVFIGYRTRVKGIIADHYRRTIPVFAGMA